MFNCIRKISGTEKQVYLSFDDGPDPRVTPALLEILEDFQSQATFFVIGEKARRHPLLLEQMVDTGHAIGDHSWDHHYRYFFQSKKKLKAWIEHGQKELAARIGHTPIGFRSPAGVLTPPLQSVLKSLGIPLIHWNRRFFDTVRVFDGRKAEKAAREMSGGDILLFHDGNCPDPKRFLEGIRTLLRQGAARGLEFRGISEPEIASLRSQ